MNHVPQATRHITTNKYRLELREIEETTRINQTTEYDICIFVATKVLPTLISDHRSGDGLIFEERRIRTVPFNRQSIKRVC